MSIFRREEHELIKSWKDGDERAFDQLFKLHFQRLFRFASRYNNDSELAKELVMDVMFKAWQKKEIILENTKTLEPFLLHLLKAAIIDQFRKKSISFLSVEEVTVEPQSGAKADDRINYNELTSIYQESLNTLSPQRRLVFEMRQDMGMSYKEIADELNISSKTVNRHLTDAFDKVRDFMRKRGA